MRFAPEESPYSFIAMVPQDVTERLLVEQLRRKGGEVEYETSFVSAVEHDERVSVTLERRGKRVEIDAAFVVAYSAHDGGRLAALESARLILEFQTDDAMTIKE